jgi:hypothetical protein
MPNLVQFGLSVFELKVYISMTLTHTHPHIYIHTYIKYVRTYIHTYVRTHIYTYIHAHIHNFIWASDEYGIVHLNHHSVAGGPPSAVVTFYSGLSSDLRISQGEKGRTFLLLRRTLALRSTVATFNIPSE